MILFRTDHPIIPAIISTLLTGIFNRSSLKFPTDWHQKPPYLSRDRSYDAFMQVLADRASEVKGAPEKRDEYLARLYHNDRTRMQVISAFLDEQGNNPWIALKKHQLVYHPNYFKLRFFTLYLLALAPVIIPFVLNALDPTLTENNASLTTLTSILATLLYSPLYDAGTTFLLFGLSGGLVVLVGIAMEFERTRPMVPGMAGLFILAILFVVLGHYVQNYVVERVDTPLYRAADQLLNGLVTLDRRLDRTPFGLGEDALDAVIRFVLNLMDYRGTIDSFDDVADTIRQAVLRFQSIVGGLFILPAVIFWGGLSAATLWELHLSNAADVTFHHQMPRPEV